MLANKETKRLSGCYFRPILEIIWLFDLCFLPPRLSPTPSCLQFTLWPQWFVFRRSGAAEDLMPLLVCVCQAVPQEQDCLRQTLQQAGKHLRFLDACGTSSILFHIRQLYTGRYHGDQDINGLNRSVEKRDGGECSGRLINVKRESSTSSPNNINGKCCSCEMHLM